MKSGIWCALLIAASVVACSSHEESEGTKAREITVEETPAEIHLPTEMWDALEGKSSEGEGEAKGKHEEAKGEEKKEGGEGAKDEASDSGALFMPVDVTLTQKNEDVLSNPVIRIHLPRGGGTIDLVNLMGKHEGSFFVNFAFPDLEDAKELQSWFVSKARARRLGDEKWGAGCGHYFRITKGLGQQMQHGGLKVNTTRNRHLTVLGGHFIFSARKNGQTFLTQVTIKDSRFGNLYCEEL